MEVKREDNRAPMPITYDMLKQEMRNSGRAYDFALVDRAYALAEAAHADQRRRSGEPYICHPLSVAEILVEMGMDSESIAAALMHDVAEDTAVTIEEIRQKFGAEVALLVDGVTKLTQIKFSNVEDRQAENLRKMLLAMSQDVRVMIIKLCDRLHNMRTGDAWPEQKRRDKALETMEVYAPIAHRLGISNIKEELEDRSLRYLDPVGYETIRALLNKHGDEFLNGVCETIRAHLEENGIENATIRHRVKSIYGIYRKMFIQNKDFEEIYDVYAVRIICASVAECYTALGLIHDMYHPLPNRFKDYISTPKPNGYQSLHTTVIGREAIPFEVQIRTWEMDRMAEYGIAAHWKYKAGISTSNEKLEERLAWVRQLLESQRSSADATDLLSDIKSDLLPEEVFAFTPRGDVINLPAGATVIDFAYAIHSAVGNRMIGAKVNNRIVPIDHQVVTGEIIEIITGPENRGPSRDWLNIVKTSEAKNKIRNWFKKERREENIAEGKDALEREMRRNLMSVPADKQEEFLSALAKRNHCNTVEEMYAAIGYGGLQMARILPKLKDEYNRLKANDAEPKAIPTVDIRKIHSSDGVVVEGIDNCPIKFAKCCSPLPGDEIIGFVTRGFGVSIHKKDCANARESMRHPENRDRWVKAYWADTVREDYKATLEIVCMDRANLVSDVALALGDMRVPIYSLDARSADQGRARMSVTIGITNTEHLNNVVARLRKVKDVVSVTRN
ncbi:MAG TPA: bifunctional (p)ppGpp synthetase/guanosine-3',5'-bis(diphosphate) 3'-pyrophosphohydrolase [Candidatus Gemmiger avicola]|uniref:GTP diphosphokinase n=1 Tax=Candidatus Gemmiger avicola TaxID=2838605 RepID=A0A9D2M5G9_9FIRM|nr:bifunctional (p)ppGpp synthetase/guanosine-3',5'-bis(diphosphate) 3'-pyrophosphohydrolase [Candidatus Gemmiger avicola]